MRLWTLQVRAAWETLERDGVLRGEWSRVAETARPCYEWYVEAASCDGPPIWAWHTFEGHRGHPALDEPAENIPWDQQGVCIEFEAPDALVTLSRFDLWCSAYGMDEEHIPPAASAGGTRPTAEQIRESWQRIFELDYPPAFPEALAIQATLPELRREWVREVIHYQPPKPF